MIKKDKIIEYIFAIILCSVFFFNLFVLNIFNNKFIFATFLLIYVLILSKILKPISMVNKDKKNIIILISIFSIIYVLILYIIGVFVGFYKNPIKFNIKTIVNRILPLIAIIFFSEIIRNIFVTRKKKLLTIIITMSLILLDISININLYKIFNLSEILSLIGALIIPAISINLLGNYIVKRYGIIPNLIYRIVTSVYIYVIPILPDIYAFFQSVFKFTFPYVVYLVLFFIFSKDNFKVALKDKKNNILVTIILLIIAILIVMLVSCKFKYGILVVGSSSMSDTINKGDVVVFENTKNYDFEEGQVIIFNKDNKVTIHRIEDIQILNNEKIFYTKGDANQTRDDGYRIESDIIGLVKFKILQIGWPTLWINELFN